MARYADYQAVADIFEAMQTEQLHGMSLAHMVGGGYAFPVAAQYMDILVDQADLGPTDRVLDIGCGCGRLAAALTQHLGPHGSYVGIDIVAGLVDFATSHITSRYPNFEFLTLQRDNPAYDQWRQEGTSRVVASLEEACEAEAIDLCIATSLFTHLNTRMACETLAAIRRALAPDGRAVISLFLIDAGVRAIIRKGQSIFRFEHEYDEGIFVENPDGPLGAVAFTSSHFNRLLAESDLYIERVLYGKWPGRTHHASGQDILVIRRMSVG